MTTLTKSQPKLLVNLPLSIFSPGTNVSSQIEMLELLKNNIGKKQFLRIFNVMLNSKICVAALR